jgi:signal transduction histidine kinase
VSEALLDVVLEQSGAQKGCLLFPRDGVLVVELEASPVNGGVAVTRPLVPAIDSGRVPASVIAYTWQTKSPVLLDDAMRAARFAKDPYLVGGTARSVLCLPILLSGEAAGLVYLENNLVGGAFTQERLVVLELLAQQAAISLRNAQLLSQESAAKVRAEEAERRSAYLARAGALLTESLDYEALSSRLARMLVGAQADFCSVQLLEDGVVRRMGLAHADPDKERELTALFGKYPLQIGSALPGAMAIRTGTVQIVNDLSDEDLRRICEDDDLARGLRALGMRNVLAVPLIARGKTLGSIALMRASRSGPYGSSDVELAQDIAYRAALAFDNARLHRETQEAVRLRDEFLAVASHELNTPMTSLVLVLQALMQRHADLPAERRYELTKVAERQAGRLTRLIGELLDVTRIGQGSIQLSRERLELRHLIRDSVARFAPELEKARCAVSLVGGEGIVGEWDRSRLEQVVSNLLANAVKFGAGQPIEIVLGTRDGRAYFELTDHGIGIDPAAQARIFDRFERAVSVRHYGGLGLGLYICRQLVEAHGGTIGVHGVPNVGTTFTVELPLRAPEHAGVEG